MTAILSWARSAIAPVGGAFNALHAHEIGAPVLQALLARAGLAAHHVDAVVLGNALGAGGNPARMTALAAGLPSHCAAFSMDSQCCAGLDAIGVAAGLIASGQANIVVAGGVEAWSRSPIRQTRPLHPNDQARTYERPAFAPDPAQDPDLLEAASEHAFARRYSRAQQNAYALLSHERARQSHLQSVAYELVAVAGCERDQYPRQLTPARAERMPVIMRAKNDESGLCGLSALTVSAKADGAALVLLASENACRELHISPRAFVLGSTSIGSNPAMPLTAASTATTKLLQKLNWQCSNLHAIELHDAFAAQGLSFCDDLGLAPEDINLNGGGLARGHPIGASGAVALVCLLNHLQSMREQGRDIPLNGLASIAGAGGLGSACAVQLRSLN